MSSERVGTLSDLRFVADIGEVTAEDVAGFFVGWPRPPSPERLLDVLRGSAHVWLARDGRRVVGLINAISDGVMSAYVPLLEVLPEYQHRGVATALMERMLETLGRYYMVDLACDERMAPFYEQFGFQRGTAMLVRNRHVLQD